MAVGFQGLNALKRGVKPKQYLGFQDVVQPDDMVEPPDDYIQPYSQDVQPDDVVEDAPQLIQPLQMSDNNQSDAEDLPPAPIGNYDYPSEAVLARRMKLAEALMGDQQEVHHPMQAIANAVSKITGAWQEKKAERQLEEAAQHRRDVIRQSFEHNPDSLDAITKEWVKSGDQQLVDLAYKYQLQALAARSRKDTRTRQRIEGDKIIQEEIGPDGKWVPYGGGPRWNNRIDPNAPLPFSDAAATIIVDRAFAGDPAALSSLSRSNNGAMIKQVTERMVTRGKELGYSDQEIGRMLAANKGLFSGYQQGQRTAGQRGALLDQAARAARGMGQIAIQQSKKWPRGNFVPLNRLKQLIDSQTGDPNVKAFYASVNSYINAYARAITPVGQPTDSQRGHAWEMLSVAQSPAQFEAVMKVLDQEMEAELRANVGTKEDLLGEFTNPKGEAQVQQQAIPAPENKVVGGVVWEKRKDGKWYKVK